jgi:hypothetical protein
LICLVRPNLFSRCGFRVVLQPGNCTPAPETHNFQIAKKPPFREVFFVLASDKAQRLPGPLRGRTTRRPRRRLDEFGIYKLAGIIIDNFEPACVESQTGRFSTDP